MLAAETIKHEVFPELQLNGIIDVNFKGFIEVVDTLGCAYVNVDHRYLHEKGENGEELYDDQPRAGLSEALLRKRARLRPLPPRRLGLRARRPSAGLPARPARADRPQQRARPDRHRREGRRARDPDQLPGVGERADPALEADRLLAGQAAATGEVPDKQRRRHRQRRRLRHLDPRTGERNPRVVPQRARRTASTGGDELQRARLAPQPPQSSQPPPQQRRLGGGVESRADILGG